MKLYTLLLARYVIWATAIYGFIYIAGRSIYDYVDTERTSREGLHKSTTTALDIGNSSNPNELSSFGSEIAIPMENVEYGIYMFFLFIRKNAQIFFIVGISESQNR